MVCGLLATSAGIEPVPPAVEAQSFKHWAAKEVSVLKFLIHNLKIVLLKDFIAKFPITIWENYLSTLLFLCFTFETSTLNRAQGKYLLNELELKISLQRRCNLR